MDIGKEDSDEEKIAALSAVVAVGEQVYVKVVEIKEDDGSGRYASAKHSYTGQTSPSMLWMINIVFSQ